MKESRIEQTFRRKLQRRGCLTAKLSDNPGWPDRLVTAPEGKHCFIEFKTVGGKLSPTQVAVTTKLTELGHLVFVVCRCEDEDVDFVMENLKQ